MLLTSDAYVYFLCCLVSTGVGVMLFFGWCFLALAVRELARKSRERRRRRRILQCIQARHIH